MTSFLISLSTFSFLLFEKQLKLLRSSINQVQKVVEEVITGVDLTVISVVEELKSLLPKMEQVYDMSLRHEIKGEAVPVNDRLTLLSSAFVLQDSRA